MTHPTPPPSVEAMRALLEAASPLPWERQDGGRYIGERRGNAIMQIDRDHDACLIVAAVNALPWLLAQAERCPGVEVRCGDLSTQGDQLITEIDKMRDRLAQQGDVVKAAKAWRGVNLILGTPEDIALREAVEALSRAALPAHDGAKGADGVALIAAERKRQVEAEGWTAKHDDEHDGGSMAEAAACYARLGNDGAYVPDEWPWAASWWKPTPNDRVRELVKAGALIAAEIDRLQRKGSPPPSAAPAPREQGRGA